jgi:gliding motility-associated-like protein
MNGKSIYILLILYLLASVQTLIAQCPSEPLFIKAPDSICAASKELVLRTSKSKENNIKYVWRLPNKDTITPDTVLIIKNPNLTHSGRYFVATNNGTCTSNSIGPFTITILGAPNVLDTAKSLTLCGLTETTISSKFKTSNSVTGFWTETEGLEVVSRNKETTLVKNLKAGENRLIWTVSTDVCKNFARDTFILNVEVTPQMDADKRTIDVRNNSITIPLVTVSGSNLNLIKDVDITFSKPKHGILIPNNKLLTYKRNGNFKGQDNFSITVCSKRCKNLCSKPINFEMDVDFDEQYPSVTMPNLLAPNEVSFRGFVIDNIEKYPSNELFILDRWGSVLVKFIDYPKTPQDIWDGTYKGRKLPAGAYYYRFNAKADTSTPPKTDFQPVMGIFYLVE